LPLLENEFSQRVNAIVQKTREMRRGVYYPHLYVVKEDGEAPLRLWALSALIQDRSDVLPSYQQFLSSIREKVSNVASFLYIVLTALIGQWKRRILNFLEDWWNFYFCFSLLTSRGRLQPLCLCNYARSLTHKICALDNAYTYINSFHSSASNVQT
jgi:hypothetical protein